jgi:two-component sensor histidine kinase
MTDEPRLELRHAAEGESAGDLAATLPASVAAYIPATNACDLDALLAAFVDDALVNDQLQDYWGKEAIAAWAARDILGQRMTFKVTNISSTMVIRLLRRMWTVCSTNAGCPTLSCWPFTFRLTAGRSFNSSSCVINPAPEKSRDLNQIQRGIQMSTSQNSASAEDGLSPALLMIEELSHRALNDYTCTISMLRLAADKTGDSSARTALIDAAQSIHERAQTFRALQAPARGQGPLDLADYLETVCKVLSTSCLASAGIRLTLIRENVRLPADQCWRLGLAVTELIMNAARHGLKWGSGEIRVGMSVGDIEVFCTVTNNGRPTALPGVGRGRRIISALVAGVGGRADWSFGPSGVCATLRIPRRSGPIHDLAS